MSSSVGEGVRRKLSTLIRPKKSVTTLHFSSKEPSFRSTGGLGNGKLPALEVLFDGDLMLLASALDIQALAVQLDTDAFARCTCG